MQQTVLGLIGDVALGVLTGTVSFTHQLPIMLTRACSPTPMWPLPELEGSQAATATSGPHGDLLQGNLPAAPAAALRPWCRWTPHVAHAAAPAQKRDPTCTFGFDTEEELVFCSHSFYSCDWRYSPKATTEVFPVSNMTTLFWVTEEFTMYRFSFGAPAGQLSSATVQKSYSGPRHHKTHWRTEWDLFPAALLRISDQSSHYLQQMKQARRNGDKKENVKAWGAEVIEDMLCEAQSRFHLWKIQIINRIKLTWTSKKQVGRWKQVAAVTAADFTFHKTVLIYHHHWGEWRPDSHCSDMCICSLTCPPSIWQR